MKAFKIASLFCLGMAPLAHSAATDPILAPQAVSTAPASPLASFSWAPSSATITVALIIKRLDEIEGQMRTLSAHFDQTLIMKDAGLTQDIDGSLDYSKPKHFNVKQEKPEPQRIVSDGETVWVWRPSKKQAIKMRFENWAKTQPFAQGLLDFGHYSVMLKKYHVKIAKLVPLEGDLKGYQEITLFLTSKRRSSQARNRSGDDSSSDGQFFLQLNLNTRNFFPYESEFEQGGIYSRSRFSHIVYNIALSSSEFHFDPPPDAQVFDGAFGGQ